MMATPMSGAHAIFQLTVATAQEWVDSHGLNPDKVALSAVELSGGVSSSVVAATGPGVAILLKQALPRLRVSENWEASVDRTETEARALGLLGELTPAAVPRLLAHDPDDHVVAMELLPSDALNWQVEIAEGRPHTELGRRAGATLGTWHLETRGARDVAQAFDRLDHFETLRLAPFHETVADRLPETAAAVRRCIRELRTRRECLVDGDYAPKNMLTTPDGRLWVCDLEVAHYGNPIFDVAFFLSFIVLSAVQWPSLARELRSLAEDFLTAYGDASGGAVDCGVETVTAHTACLVLARTDGVSPASFLDDSSRPHARAVGLTLLARPERGLWAWT